MPSLSSMLGTIVNLCSEMQMQVLKKCGGYLCRWCCVPSLIQEMLQNRYAATFLNLYGTIQLLILECAAQAIRVSPKRFSKLECYGQKTGGQRRPGLSKMATFLGGRHCQKDEILTSLKSRLVREGVQHLITSVIRKLLFIPLRILG